MAKFFMSKPFTSMNITFTGIQYLYTKKQEYDKWGPYLDTDGNLEHGDVHHTEVTLSCNIHDDNQGKHLSQYYSVFSKLPIHLQKRLWSSQISPSTMKIQVSRQAAKDTINCIPITHFKLNDNLDIDLTHRELLPLYTYMARLTRQIAAMPDATAVQKNYANFINQAVHEEACRFIDLM